MKTLLRDRPQVFEGLALVFGCVIFVGGLARTGITDRESWFMVPYMIAPYAMVALFRALDPQRSPLASIAGLICSGVLMLVSIGSAIVVTRMGVNSPLAGGLIVFFPVAAIVSYPLTYAVVYRLIRILRDGNDATEGKM